MEFKIKDGLKVKIDEKNNTASIIKSPKATGNIFIPRFFEKDNIKYKIISIEESAFQECNIDSLTFPEDSEVETFHHSCFFRGHVNKLQIPASVRQLDGFLCCIYSLNEIEVSRNNRYFTLYNNQLLLGKSKDDLDKFDVLHFCMFDVEEIVIPSQISIIKERSFYYHNKLKSIKFEENSELKEIESSAFEHATSIEDVLIPASVELIGSRSFNYTVKLKSFRFSPNSKLKKIWNKVFIWSSIESITIPDSVELICGSFCHMKKLKSLIISPNSKLDSITCSAFHKSKIESLYIPEGVWRIEGSCFGRTRNLCKIDVSSKNRYFKLIDGNYIVQESQKGSGVFDAILVARRDIENITIPSSIIKIDECAFCDCKKISDGIGKLVFPPSLISVGEYSFGHNDNLNYVEFLAKSIAFDLGCFNGCLNISTISFPNAENIEFKGLDIFFPENAKILVRKNANLSGWYIKKPENKIYYIEDIEEEEKLQKEEERKRKEDEEKLQKEDEERGRKDEEDKIRQLESNNIQLENKNQQLESNNIQLTNKNQQLESNNIQLKNKNQQLESNNIQLTNKIHQLESNNEQLTNKIQELESNEAKLQSKLNDFEEKFIEQQKAFENQKKEYENQMNQMKSMLELIMKQQSGFAKFNEEMVATKNDENEKK